MITKRELTSGSNHTLFYQNTTTMSKHRLLYQNSYYFELLGGILLADWITRNQITPTTNCTTEDESHWIRKFDVIYLCVEIVKKWWCISNLNRMSYISLVTKPLRILHIIGFLPFRPYLSSCPYEILATGFEEEQGLNNYWSNLKFWNNIHWIVIIPLGIPPLTRNSKVSDIQP